MERIFFPVRRWNPSGLCSGGKEVAPLTDELTFPICYVVFYLSAIIRSSCLWISHLNTPGFYLSVLTLGFHHGHSPPSPLHPLWLSFTLAWAYDVFFPAPFMPFLKFSVWSIWYSYLLCTILTSGAWIQFFFNVVVVTFPSSSFLL